MMDDNDDKSNGHGVFGPGGVTRLPRSGADEGREPDLLPGHLGTRMVSFAALVERVIQAFNEEHGEETAVYREADTRTKRLRLIRDTTAYVLAVESIQLSQAQKAELTAKVYSELFGYGPLDGLFGDDRVTTIALEGGEKASVRYGHGDLVSVGPLFEDSQHFRQIMRRLVLHSGAELSEEQPIIETGLVVEGRQICVNLVAPPITLQLTADIRVHPKTLPTLDDLVAGEVLTPQARALLSALAASPHGFIIVGETESGKTTLLSILAQMLPNPQGMVAVERAGELRLPEGAQRLVARWAVGGQGGVSFGDQMRSALAKNPECIILDEVRADEPQLIAPLLEMDEAPRQIWTFRGPADPNRLRSALGMVARRANTAQSEAMVLSLYRRLPFVLMLKRAQGRLQLRNVAEWQFPSGVEYPDFVMLMEKGWEGVAVTGKRPAQALPLSDDFWQGSA